MSLQVKDLIEESVAMDLHKQDYGPEQVWKWGFDGRDQLYIETPDESTEMGITDHALSQICQRLGIPFGYIDKCPPFLAAQNINYWKYKLDDRRQWFVRAHRGVCRAVMSDRYSVVDITETLGWVDRILEEKGGGNVVRSYVSPDTLSLSISFGPLGDDFDSGVRVFTGEIGNRKVGVLPWIQRTSCYNSFVWTRGGYQHPHTGDVGALRRGFMSHMVGAFSASGDLLDTLLRSEDAKLPDFSEVLTGLQEARGWNQETRDLVVMGSEGHKTVWGMANGISFAARSMPAEQRDETELLAGEFLGLMMKNVQDSQPVSR